MLTLTKDSFDRLKDEGLNVGKAYLEYFEVLGGWFVLIMGLILFAFIAFLAMGANTENPVGMFISFGFAALMVVFAIIVITQPIWMRIEEIREQHNKQAEDEQAEADQANERRLDQLGSAADHVYIELIHSLIPFLQSLKREHQAVGATKIVLKHLMNGYLLSRELNETDADFVTMVNAALVVLLITEKMDGNCYIRYEESADSKFSYLRIYLYKESRDMLVAEIELETGFMSIRRNLEPNPDFDELLDPIN